MTWFTVIMWGVLASSHLALWWICKTQYDLIKFKQENLKERIEFLEKMVLKT